MRDLSFYLISPLSEQMNSCICSNSCSTVYHISYPSRNHAKASCLFVSYKLSATAISQMAGIGPRELSILPLFTQSVWMAECHVPIHSCVGTPPPPLLYNRTTVELFAFPSQIFQIWEQQIILSWSRGLRGKSFYFKCRICRTFTFLAEQSSPGQLLLTKTFLSCHPLSCLIYSDNIKNVWMC